MSAQNKIWKSFNRLLDEIQKEQDVTKKRALEAKKREAYGLIRSTNLIGCI